MEGTNDTYKPIVSTESVQGARWLRRRLLATPGHAAVFHREGYPLKVVWPIRRDTTTPEARWFQSYDTVFQIDIGQHLLDWELTTPSDDETLGLRMHLWFACTVKDPAIIVERNIDDAKKALKPVLLPKVREAGRACSVDSCDQAERTIRDALPEPMYAEGFQLDHFMVTVIPDEAARKRLEERRQEAGRKEDREKEAKAEETRKRQKAEEEQQQRKEQRDEVRADVAFYSKLLNRADASTMWAILLAQNPSAAGQLVDRFHKQLDSRQEIFHSLLRTFLEGRGMEDYQVEQAVKVLWELLVEEIAPNRLLGGPPVIVGSSDGFSKPQDVDGMQEASPEGGA
jgi:hypothetical protein